MKPKLFILIALLFYSIQTPAQVRCSDCNGLGRIACRSCGGYGRFTCNNCKGYRSVLVSVYNPYYGVYQQVAQPCATCNGYGFLICRDCNGNGAFSCSRCSGRGYVQSNVSFKGKHCNGTVGCDCPGFDPITSGDLWEQSYCRHCSHKKSVHK